MKLATQILLGFLIAISIDLLVSNINYAVDSKVRRELEFLDRSERIIHQSTILHEHILNMRSTFRDFLLTGDTNYLAPYLVAQKEVLQVIGQERSLATLPGQRAILDSMSILFQQWTHNTDTLVTGRKALKGMPYTKESLLDTGFRQMKERQYNIRMASLFTAFQNTEYQERDSRETSLKTALNKTDQSSFVFSLILVLIATTMALYLILRISRRIRSMVKLADRIANGNFEMVQDDKKDELSNLAVSLNAMSTQLSRNIGQLEKRNAELNEYAYVVSHDLKAPVRGISHVVGWIKEDLASEISPAMQKYLDYIPERIRRMEDLIDGLLAYGRAGREAAPAEEVNVADIIHELAAFVVPKSYRLEVGPMPTLLTKRLPLQQVFSNLIGNAVKYTPADGALIRISCRDLAIAYEFSIQDNGPGIPEEYHEKVFGLFQTLREKEDKESTGIGLAIVRKIVQEHHGTVRIVSPPEGGAVFSFTWPKHIV